MSILMKFLVLVVTKPRHPEQTASPNGITWNKTGHQTVLSGIDLVTKRRQPEQTWSPKLKQETEREHWRSSLTCGRMTASKEDYIDWCVFSMTIIIDEFK